MQVTTEGRLAHADSHRHPLLDRLVARSVNLDIAADDEMWRYCLAQSDGWREDALVQYVRSGELAARAMTRVMNWHANETGSPPKVLDFASGYGRTTRFLARGMSLDALWISDIQSAGVDFQMRQFGVRGFPSCAEPDRLHVDERFDLVFVLSLFSHLPDEIFGPWLTKLYSLLTDHGTLVFSTLGESALPPSSRLNSRGFLYSERSESAAVPATHYGTLWASTDYVAARISAACAGASSRHILRGLWHLQDLHIVSKPGGPDPECLEIPTGPEGHIDAAILDESNRLHLSGWAVDRDDPSNPPRIELTAGGSARWSVLPQHPRADVAAVLGIDPRHPVGWTLSTEGELAGVGGGFFSVEARGSRADFLLHAGSLEGTALAFQARTLRSDLATAHRRVDDLASALGSEKATSEALSDRVAWMERSRFWKARNLWFALKAAARAPRR